MSLLRVLFTTATLAWTIVSVSPSNQSDSEILQKMVRAYATLHSYRHTSSVMDHLQAATLTHTGGNTAEIRWQQPNRLYMSTSNPIEGSVVTASDGHEQIIYIGRWNRYRKRSAPPTTDACVQSLREYIDPSMPDPLYFLTGKGIPKTLTDVELKRTEAVDGAPCYVVAGTMNQSASTGHAMLQLVFWVDRRTYLLRKVRRTYHDPQASRLIVTVKKGRRIVEPRLFTLDRTITEFIHNPTIDPPLTEADFTISLPKGAVKSP